LQNIVSLCSCVCFLVGRGGYQNHLFLFLCKHIMQEKENVTTNFGDGITIERMQPEEAEVLSNDFVSENNESWKQRKSQACNVLKEGCFPMKWRTFRIGNNEFMLQPKYGLRLVLIKPFFVHVSKLFKNDEGSFIFDTFIGGVKKFWDLHIRWWEVCISKH